MLTIKFIDNHAHKFPLELENTKPSQYRDMTPGETAQVSERQAASLLSLFPDQFELLDKKLLVEENKMLKKTATFKSK